MRITLRYGDHHQEITLDLNSGPDPTIETVSSELGLDRCHVDGILAPPSDDAGLWIRHGSEISASGPDVAHDLELIAVCGQDSAKVWPLRSGTSVLGRYGDVALASPTVSRRHCTLDVDAENRIVVTDLGSCNGTEIDGRFVSDATVGLSRSHLRLGTTVLRARPAWRPTRSQDAVLADVSGTISFNRPPRTMLRDADAVPAPPPPPSAAGPMAHLSIFRLVMPLVVGAAMALMFSPRMALFGLMSPLMMFGTWLSNRRRGRRDARRAGRGYRHALDDFMTEFLAVRALHLQRARQRLPDIADTIQRARSGDPRLWQRRPSHEDFAQINIGVASIDWAPESLEGCDEAVRARIETLGPLANTPVTLDVSSTIGIVGPDASARALARSILIQLAVHHGPADVKIVAMTDLPAGWRWIEWLPHCTSHGVDPIGDTAQRRAELTGWRHESGSAHRWVVVDDHRIVDETPGLRESLAGADRGIVLVSNRHLLPDSCKSIVVIDADTETALVEQPAIGAVTEDVLVASIDSTTAAAAARTLARFRDPEAAGSSAHMARRVRLVDLIDFGDDAGDTISDRWTGAAEKDSLEIPIGHDAGGVRSLDLVADGPHALVAGTTGSGKSELLRTIVASLAAHHSPTEVNFVLIDYKGGSAFDACADFAHTVGIVTDLDDRLAQRALRCLEAELRLRESLLRACAASDIAQYRSLCSADEALPRLVVIIDEFATLAAELPDFIDALVDIAQRGRSLGVHLILATQRPAGAIKENIKTNTNLRIALRVVDRADSTDVVSDPAAATIGRHLPGRGFLRLGPGELVEFQAAIVSERGPSHHSSATLVRRDDIVAPPHEQTDLERLVEVVNGAWADLRRTSPRRPWPDPLPHSFTPDRLFDYDTHDDGIALALCDLPHEQRFEPWVWRPRSGHLLCYSRDSVGSILATAVRLVTSKRTVGECHVYALDQGDRTLEVLRGLPHCGAVIGPDERERQQRLVRFLDDTLRVRRSGHQSGPELVVAIASWATLCAEFDGYAGSATMTALNRLFSDGAQAGIHLLVGASRAQAIPASLAATTANRLAFSLAERSEYLAFGLDLAVDPAKLPPGRGFHVGSGLEVQMPSYASDDRVVGISADEATVPDELRPQAILTLPDRVELSSLYASPIAHTRPRDDGPLELVFGLCGESLLPLSTRLHLGDHLAVLGPSRSGRSTALATIARSALDIGCQVSILAARPSILAATDPRAVTCDEADIADRLEELDGTSHLTFVDDAELFDDIDGVLASVLQRPRAHCHVILSTRADHLRAGFRHWSIGVRRSRHAVLLRPDETDGDLFGTRLDPRLEIAPIAGRGVYLSDGTVTTCQVATPEARR